MRKAAEVQAWLEGRERQIELAYLPPSTGAQPSTSSARKSLTLV